MRNLLITYNKGNYKCCPKTLKNAEIRKILIIHYGAIGDFIAATIAIKALRDTFSKAHIALLSRENTYEITPPGSIIDEYIVLQSKSIKEFLQKLFYIRSQNFDIVVNLKENSEVMHFISFLSGAKKKVGTRKGIWRSFYNFYPSIKADVNQHEYLKNLRVVESIGAKNEKIEAFVAITKKDIDRIKDFIQNNQIEPKKFLIVAPGASDLRKAWRIERFVELCRRIIKTYDTHIVVTWGSETEQKLAQKILEDVKINVLIFPRSKIGSLAELVRNAILCICNNSGIMHIAYAVKTPVICLNTSISWQAFGENNYNINAFGENISKNKHLPNDEVRKLLDTISVEQVWEIFQVAWHKNYQNCK